MDENGKAYNSRAFAQQLQKWLNAGHRRMVFLIGGAYGFHQNVIDRADHKMRLSDMTFNHQVVRILFCEQLYRAFAILNNHPYHND
jgi:23S rRNA (pseudouridine1915-N3)-methyltransferase